MDTVNTSLFISHLLKKEIKSSSVKVNELAQKFGRTKQSFYSVLRGEMHPDPNIVKFILKETNGIDFDFSDEVKELCKTKYFEDLEAFYFVDNEVLSRIESEVSYDWYYSIGLPYYLMLKSLILIENRKAAELHTFVLDLDKHFSTCINPSAKFLIHAKLSDCLINRDFNKALSIIPTIPTSSASTSHYDALINQLIGITYCELHKPLDSLYYSFIAAKQFSEDHSVAYSVATNGNIGNAYLQLGNYEKALVQYNKTLSDAKRFNRYKVMNSCYANIAYCHFVLGNYDKALENKPITINGRYYPIHLIQLCWASYFSNNTSLLNEYILYLEQSIKNKYQQLMFELINLYKVQASFDTKIAKLIEMLNLSYDHGLVSDQLWCLRFLIKEYEDVKDYESITKYQKEVLRILNFNSL